VCQAYTPDFFTPQEIFLVLISVGERAVEYRLRDYATNRQVAGSIPDGVIGIFQ
jgi:hypothetical protein